ncbi:MAG: type II toxin-antitoxin system HipA family toxin [Anaerovoracaceae bacterium]
MSQNTAKVTLWGTTVGVFHLDENRSYVAFEYDKDFIDMGVEVSPIMMPLSRKIYEFPDLVSDAFKGLPGLLADSLPDKYGNALINQWLAREGRTPDSFNVVERLCYTGTRGMGALEYVPALTEEGRKNEKVNLSKMIDLASLVLQEKEEIQLSPKEGTEYKQLLRLGTSAGGARAKAIVAYNEATGDIRSGQIDTGLGYNYWLIKLDGVRNNGDYNTVDVSEYTMIEYAYYLMAKSAKITMNECRLLEENDRKHFMTKRFDRVNNAKLHMQTLAAIAHVDYNVPGQYSYELAALNARRIGVPNNDIDEFFRRMVFNVLSVNQDDHVKNISFLMNKDGEWRLSPAYDMTFARDYSNQWLKSHQMTINGKKDNISYDDMLTCGQNMDLKSARCKKIIEEVVNAVASWRDIANKIGINEKTISAIEKEIKF